MPIDKESLIRFKIFEFIGAVGKTSLVLRYVEDTFNPSHITTLQVFFFFITISIAIVMFSRYRTGGHRTAVHAGNECS